MKIEDISNALHTISENVDTVANVKNRSSNIKKNFIEGRNYSQTEKYKKELAEAVRIGKKHDFILGFFLILWVLMIISTIILCIVGNDIILRLLHI